MPNPQGDLRARCRVTTYRLIMQKFLNYAKLFLVIDSKNFKTCHSEVRTITVNILKRKYKAVTLIPIEVISNSI